MKTIHLPANLRSHSCRLFFLSTVLLLTAGHGAAADIYKYRQADGTVLYSQKPIKKHAPLKVLHVAPPTAQQLQAQRAARRQLMRLQAKSARLASERTAQAGLDNQAPAPALAAERTADRLPPVLSTSLENPPVIGADNNGALPEARRQQIRAQAAAYEEMRQQIAQEQTIAR